MIRLPLTIMGLAMLLTIQSCKKKDQPEETPQPKETVWKQVTNLKVTESSKWIFYSLENNKIITADKVDTDEWDFAFLPDGIGMSIAPNNSTCSQAPFPAGKGNGWIQLVTKDILEVKEAGQPHTDLCNYVMSQYTFGEYVLTDGWCKFKEMYADGGLLEIVPERTLIIKTAKGKYAKLQIQGIYKDNPVNPPANAERYYLKFRYVIQHDGSENLNISLDIDK